MPAKDIYHQIVKDALIKDGWTITDDPLKLTIGSRSLYVDLGASKLLAAQKEDQKIAVEIKSFLGASPINDERKRSRSICSLSKYSPKYRCRENIIPSD